MRVWHPRLKDGVDKTLRPVTLSAGGERASKFAIELSAPDRRWPRPTDYDPADYQYNPRRGLPPFQSRIIVVFMGLFFPVLAAIYPRRGPGQHPARARRSRNR